MMWSRPIFSHEISGTVVKDKKTKQLLRRIRPGQIAVIHHRDLDEVAAAGLVEKQVKAVINAGETISGAYPTPGPAKLLAARIPVLDGVGERVFDQLNEGDRVWVEGDALKVKNEQGERVILARGKRLTPRRLQGKIEEGRSNMEAALERFIENTLHYAGKEQTFVTRPLPVPRIRTRIRGRHVVVVVRGAGFKEDLSAIRSYIEEVRPVLIGVDGGADALLEYGWKPDVILGDMDSVSDRALLSGAEIIVHAYPDGKAPGSRRIEELGLAGHLLPSVGTSEDIAMLLAYQEGAELIVAVGTHSNMVDFLEKGRKGMASTLLVRMKIGTRLVDAKGVNKLYRGRMQIKELWLLGLASAFPVAALATINPNVRHIFRMLWLNLKMMWTQV